LHDKGHWVRYGFVRAKEIVDIHRERWWGEEGKGGKSGEEGRKPEIQFGIWEHMLLPPEKTF
jgi:hypothetical protein